MFSENLIHLRKARRLTQEAVAEKVGVTRQAVAKWEAGDSMPDLETGLFGIVSVGDKGQIIIPARARKIFDISPGDQLVVLGDEGQGLAIMKASGFMNLANAIRQQMTAKPDDE